MANQYVNKVVINNQTKIDLTADTVAAAYLLENYTAHDQSGAPITGSCTYDADTSDANATAAQILSPKTAYVAGAKVTGSMPNIGTQSIVISALSALPVGISTGYHDGSGTATIDSAEVAKIIAGNIKNGVSILGVTGTLEPSSEVTAQAKSATPSFSSQTILPDADYDYLSQVTVAAIPVTYVDNAQGGQTCTVG